MPGSVAMGKRAVEQRPMPIGSQEPIKEAGTEACGRPINQPIAAEEGREEAGRTGGRASGRAVRPGFNLHVTPLSSIPPPAS